LHPILLPRGQRWSRPWNQILPNLNRPFSQQNCVGSRHCYHPPKLFELQVWSLK
jgi:hypothetical protein